MVVDYVIGKDSTLSLWQEEERKFLILLALIDLSSLMWVMDIKHTSRKSRTHLTTVISIHTERTALTEGFVTVGELA